MISRVLGPWPGVVSRVDGIRLYIPSGEVVVARVADRKRSRSVVVEYDALTGKGTEVDDNVPPLRVAGDKAAVSVTGLRGTFDGTVNRILDEATLRSYDRPGGAG